MATSYEAEKLQKLGYGDLAKIITEEVPVRASIYPFVQEYSAAKILTPELIDYTWQGIWKAIGGAVEFEYQVPTCDRTIEELTQLRKNGRAVLLLPYDIYTSEGLVRLGKAFPLMKSRWVTDPERAKKISHISTKGGSIDIEMGLKAPYRTSKGYTQQELIDKIIADNRFSQRLPTYLIGSQFSRLLTKHYFDEKTYSRLPGSFCGRCVLNVAFGEDGRVSVFTLWGPQGQDSGLGGRTEGFKKN